MPPLNRMVRLEILARMESLVDRLQRLQSEFCRQSIPCRMQEDHVYTVTDWKNPLELSFPSRLPPSPEPTATPTLPFS